jgi:hypothetical protein
MRTASLLIVVLAFSVVWCSTAPATWPHDPTLSLNICDEAGNQSDQQIIEDGKGGWIIVWCDYRYTDGRIYAQRLSSTGDVLWTTDGVVICSAAYNQTEPKLVSDGLGGAIIAWRDARTGSDYDIYAQRVDSTGSTLWTTNGVAVCTAGLYESGMEMCTDGAGGAILVWYDARNTYDYDIYAQRIDGSGSVQWAAAGVAVCTATGDQYYPKPVSDGSSGAFVVWTDYRNGGADVYAGRINSSGGDAWGGQLNLCNDANAQYVGGVAPDGFGGVIVTWRDLRSAPGDIYAQSFESNGAQSWTANGLPVCQAATEETNPVVIGDGEGGAIIAWTDARASVNQIYAQRVASWGTALWTTDGIQVSQAGLWSNNACMTSDGAGGAVLVWQHDGVGSSDISAQRIDDSGSALWPNGGVPVAIAAGYQVNPKAASDGAGGLVMAWQDERVSFLDDIYAQRIDRHGYLGLARPTMTQVADYPGDQGGVAVVSWGPSYLDAYPNEVVTHYTVWRRMQNRACGAATGGAALHELAKEFGLADALERSGWSFVGQVEASYLGEYACDSPTYGDSTASGNPLTEYMVIANTDDQWVFWESESLSGYSVDNLAPGAPLALDADAVQVDVNLVWSASGYHDEDLALYNIYRSDTPGFAPSEATFVDTATDTLYADVEPGGGTWFYLVTAEDIHGNESDPSNEASAETWTGVDGTIPTVLAIRGNAPNPFNPTTTIAYDLPADGHVRLDVYTAAGGLVTTVEDGFRTAGLRQAVWNGTDTAGNQMPSGVYFARLVAGEETAVHRMVLLK